MDQAVYELLTDAERDVLRRLASGRRAGEIATDTGRSVSTIRNQLHSARVKAGSSDSLALARGLAAYEACGQSLPRSPMPMADPGRGDPLAIPPDRGRLGPQLEIREDRAVFTYDVPLQPAPSIRSQGAVRNDLKRSPLLSLGTILAITVFMMMCIALAPEMGRTFQTIANLLYPPQT